MSALPLPRTKKGRYRLVGATLASAAIWGAVMADSLLVYFMVAAVVCIYGSAYCITKLIAWMDAGEE